MIHLLFPRARTVLLALLAYSPAFLTLRLIARYGVDLGVADDWDLVPFLLKAHEHSLSFFDFFSQHNEHRYVFPRLILLVLAPLTSGNLKGQMFCSVVLVILASGAVWYLLCRTTEMSLDKRLLLLGLVNLFLFSPVQVGNWTWGSQFVLFLVNLLLAGGVVVAVSRLSLLAKFGLCLVITLVATFSFGGGVVMWLIIFPVALLYETRVSVRQRYWWLAGWLFAWLATMAGYFFHYAKPPHHPKLLASHNPVDYFLYITRFLGAHLAPISEPSAAIFGTILMVFYFSGTLWAIRSRNASLRSRMLPWLGIGAFVLANAALGAVTRIGFGINQGMDSRYTTFALYISISVIGMFAVIATTAKSDRNVESKVTTGMRWLTVASLISLLLSHGYTSAWGIKIFRVIQRDRLHGKAALLFANVVDSEPARLTYLNTEAREYADREDRIGYIHPPLIQTPELSKLDSRPQEAGFLERVNLEGQTCKAFGWAMIPKGYRPADAVLLAYDDPARGPIAFAFVVPTLLRSEVVQAVHDDRVGLSGWSLEFDRSKVPPGDQRITAWAFDADKALLYPLINAHTIR
jgi:hypothetical protein